MFWRYNLITGSCIETLLDKENVTLKELMEEEDILQECKAQNKKLIDFLVRPEIVEEMVGLMIQEPPEEEDVRLRYRYANRACELLTFDIMEINDALVAEEAPLTKLCSFLKTDQPLNPLLASFFSKTMGLLFNRKTRVMLLFLEEEDFVNQILKHLDTSAIMDLLLRCLTIENIEMRVIVIDWLNDQKLIPELISRIDVDYREEFSCNASYAICDIIKTSREHMSLMQEKAEPNPLLENIESLGVIADLLDHMFKDVTREHAIVNGVLILQSLLVFKKQGSGGIQPMPSSNQLNDLASRSENATVSWFLTTLSRSCENEQMSPLDAKRLAKAVFSVVTAIYPFLIEFHNLLLKPPVKPAITFTIGCLDPPLGNCRLEVTRLIKSLLFTNSHLVNVQLASLGTVIVLMDMFFKYSWNNFLHTQVEQSLGYIIGNPPTVDKEGNKGHPLLDQILVQYKITNKIVESFKEDPGKAVPGVHRKGFMGHLAKMANHIAQNSENGENSSLILEKLKELPEDDQKQWEDFVSETLSEINKKNRICVVSGPAVSSSTDDEAVDFRDVPFGKDSSVHLAFSDYQMHEMTSNFVDQFGFDEDGSDETLFYKKNNIESFSSGGEGNNLKSAELFEEVCNSKINSDGDAVLWAERDNPTSFNYYCFQMNKSSEETNSSDSDEESQVFEAETTTTTAEDVKMEIDNQEAILDGVPMEVASTPAQSPWGESESSNSATDDQQNWADFSNFASFGSATSEQAGAASDMETSETLIMTEKSVATSSSVSVCSKTELDEEKMVPADIPILKKEPDSEPSVCNVSSTSPLSNNSADTITEPFTH